MDVGIQMIFSTYGWPGMSDREAWQQEIHQARIADEVGFDVIWSVEHHFFDYSFCPDNTQLTVVSGGHVPHIDLGTAAMILPWHDPLRIAEQAAVLDYFCNGRLRLGHWPRPGPPRVLRLPWHHGRIRASGSTRRRRSSSSRCAPVFMEGNGKFYPQPASKSSRGRSIAF